MMYTVKLRILQGSLRYLTIRNTTFIQTALYGVKLADMGKFVIRI